MTAETPTVDAPVSAEMSPAKSPVAAPLAAVWAIVFALGLIAVGVVAARDALLSTDVITGSPWIAACLAHLDGLTAQDWMLPVGVMVAVLGLVVLFAAVKPRRRTHLPLREPGIWITAKDCTRLAGGASDAVTGVATTTVGGSARKVALTVTPVAGYDTAALSAAVKTAVDTTFTPLARPPRVRVRVKEQDLP